MSTTTCNYCGGTGKLEILQDDTDTMYGKHIIGKNWSKIDNVWIWFAAFNQKSSWRGIQGYIYETDTGEYLAPFRGDLIPVTKDTKDEFRELTLAGGK